MNPASNLHYTRAKTPKRVTSGGTHYCGLAPGQHSFEETSQRRRAVACVTQFLSKTIKPVFCVTGKRSRNVSPVLESSTFNHKILGSNLSTPDKRSNRETKSKPEIYRILHRLRSTVISPYMFHKHLYTLHRLHYSFLHKNSWRCNIDRSKIKSAM